MPGSIHKFQPLAVSRDNDAAKSETIRIRPAIELHFVLRLLPSEFPDKVAAKARLV